MHRRAVLWLIAGTAAWGLSFPVQKMLTMLQQTRVPEAGSWFLTSWIICLRSLLAAGLLFLWRPKMLLGMTRNEVTQGLLLGLIGGMGLILQADGLAHTQASTSAFLTQAYCVILPLIEAVRRRQAPGPRTWIATLLVIMGGGILAGVTPDSLKIGPGEAATLIAAFIFTFQILTLENPKYEKNRGLMVTFSMCAFIALMFLPLSWILAPEPGLLISAGASWPAFLLILTLALLCSVGAYGLMNSWQPRVSATEAGLIYTIEPVFTAGYALFLPAWLGGFVGKAYPNETLTFSLVVGGSLILAANVIMQWKRPPHDPSIAPAP